MPYREDGVGFRATDTSEAAAPTESRAATLRERVRQALLQRPMTSDELAEHLGVDRGSVQPRTSELRNAGLIFDTGQRRRLRSGKVGIVWKALSWRPGTARDLFDETLRHFGGAK